MAAGPVALDRLGLDVVLDGDQHALEEHAHDRLSSSAVVVDALHNVEMRALEWSSLLVASQHA
jgi:hypothetical protein